MTIPAVARPVAIGEDLVVKDDDALAANAVTVVDAIVDIDEEDPPVEPISNLPAPNPKNAPGAANGTASFDVEIVIAVMVVADGVRVTTTVIEAVDTVGDGAICVDSKEVLSVDTAEPDGIADTTGIDEI